MSILETRKVRVYDFENRDGETKYGFVIKFVEQDELYTPYLTNSRTAIGLFVDPIEYAEMIQDEGAKYTVTPNAIIFEDAESADVAADILAEQLRKTPLHKVEELLYNFAKDNYFGKKQWFLDQLRQPNQCEGSDVPEVILEAAFKIYTEIRDNGLLTTVYGSNEDKTSNIISYDLATGELTTDENHTVHLRDVIGFNVEDIDLSIGTWYSSSAACTN